MCCESEAQFYITEMTLMYVLSHAVQRELRPKLLLLGNHSIGLSSQEEVFYYFLNGSNLTGVRGNEKF